ncbi:hypothetical protein MNBD_GAMMA08-2948 [hydrothermal vent metagenome]|uniref:Uncharacterized protein n=1 Tax=hydrothermal vent metagenome TaxID=652676 RepID=A0A3B0Y7H7_9ZZZZ
MQIVFKKLAYLLLTLALFNLPAQMFFAPYLQHHKLKETVTQINNQASNHCQQTQFQYFVICEQCDCDMNIRTLANFLTPTKLFLHTDYFTDNTIENSAHYTQPFQRPLLRPPIT